MSNDRIDDPRLAAFLRPDAPEVFHAIQHRNDVFRPDPFDVEEVHAAARGVFDEVVAGAHVSRGRSAGRFLLVLGESGAGKTHLMRAFRTRVHQDCLGFVAYVQMTSSSTNYLRYLLRNVLESLDVAYDPIRGQTSGLELLSDDLVRLPGACSKEERAVLREEDDPVQLRKMVWRVGNRIANRCLAEVGRNVDPDVVFQLLFLQRRLPIYHRAAIRFLACENLGDRERELLGGVAPRTQDEDPLTMLTSLGALISILDGGAFVVCVDQLEDAYEDDEAAKQRFRKTMLGLRELTDALPNAVVVLACLENYWSVMQAVLSRSILDRVLQDPPPVQISGALSEDEARRVVGARVAHLLETADVEPDPDQPIAPFREEQLARFRSFRVRDLLEACRRARAAAIASGLAPVLEGGDEGPATPFVPETAEWSTRWSDFREGFDAPLPDAEEELAGVLAEGFEELAVELAPEVAIAARAVDNRVEVIATVDGGPATRIVAGVCERAARGGGLARQLNRLINKAGDRIAAVVRSTEFPGNPATQIARQIGEFVADGGRRAVCGATQWKAMLAMRAFARRHAGASGFAAWRRRDRPLASLQVFQDVLRPSELGRERPRTPRSDAVVDRATPPTAAPEPAAVPSARLRLGTALGIAADAVELELQELTRHAAFLGGTGSGKTTLALSVVEQALERGIPVLMVDRKGDLPVYADPERWAEVDPERHERAVRLRRRIDVQVYTPGDPSGHDLAIPILPTGPSRLSERERESLVQHYASALAGMLDSSRSRSATRQRTLAILQAGLTVLDACGQGRRARLDDLIRLCAGPDPALVQAIGQIEPRQLAKVAEQLQVLAINERALLSSDAPEDLDVGAMLGIERGARAPTRLAIVSTVGLGQPERVLFLVTHLLVELARLAERHPSDTLQALVLLDEADLYLPAVGQPPTKAPLEHALRRFRSAGIGVMLATQSPGDLDYRSRENVHSWFVGRVTQTTALKKVEPLFGPDHAALDRVPRQGVGEFHLLRDGRALAFHAERSLLDPRQLAPERIVALCGRG